MYGQRRYDIGLQVKGRDIIITVAGKQHKVGECNTKLDANIFKRAIDYIIDGSDSYGDYVRDQAAKWTDNIEETIKNIQKKLKKGFFRDRNGNPIVMRDTTPEENASIEKYISEHSIDTGVNFFELLESNDKRTPYQKGYDKGFDDGFEEGIKATGNGL